MNLLKYRFTVSISNTHLPPMCKYPREKIITGIRQNKYIYEDDQIKKVIYPVELLFTEVTDNDYIENHIIELKNMWPQWYNIEIEKFN
jgi:hypothetical protein